MRKPIIAVFFMTFFMIMIVTPSVVTLLNLDYDITLIVDTSEEEEKEGKESSKDKDIKILQVFKNNVGTVHALSAANPRFYSNTYTSSFRELISPPPERFLSV